MEKNPVLFWKDETIRTREAVNDSENGLLMMPQDKK